MLSYLRIYPSWSGGDTEIAWSYVQCLIKCWWYKMDVFFWQKVDGMPRRSYLILCISSCTVQNELFFLWKLSCSFLRSYIICTFPALHNSAIVHAETFCLNSSCTWTVVCFTFCSPFLWLTDSRIEGALIPSDAFTERFVSVRSLAQAKPCLQMCMCILPLISVRFTDFWVPYLAFNLL